MGNIADTLKIVALGEKGNWDEKKPRRLGYAKIYHWFNVACSPLFCEINHINYFQYCLH